MSRVFAVPARWGDVIACTWTTYAVAFLALLVKEWMDGGLDVPACAVDASWIAAGIFLLNAILVMVMKPARETDRKKALSYG